MQGGVVPSDILSTHAKNYEAAACRLLAEDSAACAVPFTIESFFITYWLFT
jgi:hypothetical protein